LYLVKLQAEALGGSITVRSELNKYTTFSVKLRKPENAERQVLYHESFAEIFFDARLNCIGTIWHKKVNADQYNVVTKKIFDFIHAYNTPNYMSNLMAEGTAANFNLDNIFAKGITDAMKQGLSRIAVIVPDPFPGVNGEQQMALAKLGIALEFFPTMTEAVKWIENENLRTSVTLTENG
jgi:hypothetical protein